MKKLIIILFVLILSLTIFCACGNRHNEQGGEVQMKPFASPNPNNPYDEKSDYEVKGDFWEGYFYIELINAESLNNIFYDYKIENFLQNVNAHIEDALPEALEVVREHIRKNDKSEESKKKIAEYTRYLCVKLDGNQSKEQIKEYVRILNQRDYIRNAHPQAKQTSSWFLTSNDYNATDQWGLNKINITQAWEETTGSSSVKVGVIDTGILASQTSHVDLYGNVSQILGQDRRVTEPGYTSASFLCDQIGHGTTVAGVIGAKGNNNQGIVGVCWNVDMVSLRADIYNSQETDVTSVINALTYATNNGIKIINFSSGWYVNTLDYSKSYLQPTDIANLRTAIQTYPGLIIVAAGNEYKNIDNLPLDDKLYPHCFLQEDNNTINNMIIVGASDQNNNLAVFDDDPNNYKASNYGANTVDLFAPGIDIKTTKNNGVYDNVSGTSVAAPFVAGVAALLLSKYPNITTSMLKACIVNNVTGSNNLLTKCIKHGVLNAQSALQNFVHTHVCDTATFLDNTKHRGICRYCNEQQDISHIIDYDNVSIYSGHTKICYVCSHSFGFEPHIWMAEYILGTPHGYSCRKCHVWTQYIDLPHPDFAPGTRGLLDGIEIGENGIGVLPISEHVAIIYDNGRYGLIIECDENGKPLSKIPKEIFAKGFDVDALQKELDKKTEWVIPLQDEKNKKLKESSKDE